MKDRLDKNLIHRNFHSRYFRLFFIFFHLNLQNALSQYQNQNNPSGQTQQKAAPIPGRYEESYIQKKALENPQIKGFLQQCMAKASQEVGAQGNSGAFEEAKDRCMQEVFSKLPPQLAKSMAAQTGIEDPDLLDNVKFRSNPAYQNLQDYLQRRLREALYGETTTPGGALTKPKKVVDHKTFYDLFKTQLGKNIISTISSYCVNSDERGLISSNIERRKIQRQANIQKLSEATQDPNAASKGGSTGLTQGDQVGIQNQGFAHFGGCIPIIAHICGRTKYLVRYSDGTMGENNFGSDHFLVGKSEDEDEDLDPLSKSDIEYTRNQACVVTRELKRLRKELLAMKKIEKRLQELKTDASAQNSIQTANQVMYGRNYDTKEKTIDDLTTLTSNEFSNKAKMGMKFKEQAMMYERECLNAVTPKCAELMNNNQDYAKFLKMKDEYVARTQIMKGKISGMTEAEVKQFLLDEGRTAQEVNLIIQQSKQDQASLKLQDRVADMYNKEREAIIKSMSQKLRDSNIQMGHEKPPTVGGASVAANQEESKALREKMAVRLADMEAEVRDTLLFNNMVSGYLSAEDERGVKSSNSRAAYRELNDSYYNPANALPGQGQPAMMGRPGANGSAPAPVPTIDPNFFQQLQAATQKSLPNTNTEKKEINSTVIEVPTLNNQILGNYLDNNPDTQKQMDNLNDQQRKQEKAKAQMDNNKTPQNPPYSPPQPSSPNNFRP